MLHLAVGAAIPFPYKRIHLMKIVTWNVNSVRMRLNSLLDWLKNEKPDVVLLQETKVIDELFPLEPIEDLGYNIAIYGQKAYNGVAILSLSPMEDITKGLPNFSDPSARYIEAVINNVRVASIYVPNGKEVGCDSYYYKLDFLKALKKHLTYLKSFEEKFILGGDFNIAPQDMDVYDPVLWKNKILCSPQEREHFYSLVHEGYEDALRLLYPHDAMYTWWNYRARGWERNGGLRIDHFLISPGTIPVLKSAGVHDYMRAKEKASDHAPVWCELKKD